MIKMYLRKAICLMLLCATQVAVYANDWATNDFSQGLLKSVTRSMPENDTPEPGDALPIGDTWWLPLAMACMYMAYKYWKTTKRVRS